MLVAEFSRPFDTGKFDTDYAINTFVSMMVIWSLHPSAARVASLADLPHHVVQGNAKVFFGADDAESAAFVCGPDAYVPSPRSPPPPPGPQPTPTPAAASPPTTGQVEARVHSSFATSDGAVSLSWNRTADGLSIRMVSRMTGWVAVGFNDRPLMAGADMYVGWVSRKTGAATVLDTHAVGRSPPRVDAEHGGHNDATHLFGILDTVNGSLTVQFTRALDTGDPHDRVLTSDPVYLLWAQSNEPKRVNIPYAKHSNYGIALVRLWDPATLPAAPAPPAEAAAPAAHSDPPTLPEPDAPAAIVPPVNNVFATVRPPQGDVDVVLALADDGQHVVVTVSAATGGWVGVGFHARPEMAGADMVVGWVDSSGVAHAYDMFAPDYAQPSLDTALGGTDSISDVRVSTTGKVRGANVFNTRWTQLTRRRVRVDV
jgi:hypothetical protein